MTDRTRRPGTLVGVGVGPGDPRHVTLAAIDAVRGADRVMGPTMDPGSPGRAESIIRAAVPGVEVERLVFAIQADEPGRAAAHAAAARRVARCLGAGDVVAFVTLGDPNVYSTFHHLADAVRGLRPETRVETVPGIMAFQDLAARAGTVVVDGAQRLHLVTAVGGTGDLDAVVGDRDAAIVVYKGGRELPAIAARLAAAGRLEGAVAGELLGLPGERVAPLSQLAGGPAAYLASVVVPPGPRGEP
ncbi:MAG: precorrin-2 C(20)-methyltransferase [Acidimicrobiales bacterium]